MKRIIGISLYIVTGFVLAGIASASIVTSKRLEGLTVKALESTQDFDDTTIKHPLTVVKFYAPWCGFCMRIKPTYLSMAKQYPQVVFTELNSTTEYGKQLAAQYLIQGFPTFVLIKKGKEHTRVVGANENELREKLNKFVQSTK